MLPPADLAVLERNPRFKALYENLCTQKLTPEGVTRDSKRERVRGELEKKLAASQANYARSQILLDALDTVARKGCGGPDGLPNELVNIVKIVSAQLQDQVDPDDRVVLEDDIDYVLSNAAPVAHAIQSHISFHTHQLAAIVDTTPAELPETVSNLIAEVTYQTREANALRLTIASSATQLERLRLELLQSLIRGLEQVIHGAVARHSKARAEHLALVASGLHSKTKLMALAETVDMDPALKNALRTYGEALEKAHSALLEDERKLSQNLNEYEKGGNTIRELARHYRDVLAETEEVKSEIAQLEAS